MAGEPRQRQQRRRLHADDHERHDRGEARASTSCWYHDTFNLTNRSGIGKVAALFRAEGSFVTRLPSRRSSLKIAALEPIAFSNRVGG
jgi:hypothetical protein